jgi:hypothetical protein
MKKSAGLITGIFLLFTSQINAQASVAIRTLSLNPDPLSNGLGGTGVSLPSSYPLGFYNNPAILGYSGQTNNFAFQYYPIRITGNGTPYSSFNSMAITAGYNFGKLTKNLNLSLGIGFISSKFDYGMYAGVWNLSTAMGKDLSYDKYNAFGLGISLNYLVNLSLGISIKNIDSKSIPQPPLEEWLPGGETKLDAVDWGLLINIPISRLAGDIVLYRLNEDSELKPVVNLSLGYTRSNIGDDVKYAITSMAQPLPLTAKLGYTFSFGADLLIKNYQLNLITWDIIIEVEDLLVTSVNNFEQYSYQGLLGDIKPWENLIAWKRTDNVTLRKGQMINMFETVAFFLGSYINDYSSYYNNRSYGFILSTDGIFNFLSWQMGDNPYIKFFLNHFGVKYSYAMGFNDYDIRSLSVSFSKLTF